MPKSITLIKPDDWHLHLRDGDALNRTVNDSAKHFKRALVMPNLTPPLTTLKQISDYRQRVLRAITPGETFLPYFNFYLNESVSADELIKAKQQNFILGAKLYPKGATTNSDAGAQSLKALYPLLDTMQEHDLVLQVHGEVTEGDIFEREAAFIATELSQITKNFPKLRIVLEHVSTRAGIEFVAAHGEQVAATITVHHLLYNRNHMLAGGIKPHYYCLPILKDAANQKALQQAVMSGNPKFFLGTDSAPHAIETKESACGCAGVYSAPYALALYTECFEQLNALDKLENFASRFGADFYRLPYNKETITLNKTPQTTAASLPYCGSSIVPIAANSTLLWCVDES